VSGSLWLALGIAIYALYRRRLGLDLVTTAKIVVPQAVTESEAEYDSVLIALEVDHFTPQIVATAARLAARGGRGIYVLVTITVPQALPLDAKLPEQEATAASVIQHARLLAGRRVSGRAVKVRAGQSGRVIIDEARAIRAKSSCRSRRERAPRSSERPWRRSSPSGRAASSSRASRRVDDVIGRQWSSPPRRRSAIASRRRFASSRSVNA